MITQVVYSNLELDKEQGENDNDENCDSNNNNSDIDIYDLQYDAREYLAGYIIKKLGCENLGQFTTNQTNQNSWTWVDEVSEGGLIKPSPEFMKILSDLELIFININGKQIKTQTDYLKFHIKECAQIDISLHIKMLFFKCRLYFRIRELNKCIRTEKYQRKLKKTIT